MAPRFDAIGMVVKDMAATLTFYRLLGLDIPEEAGSEGHVEAALPGGTRLMFDTEDMVRSFDSNWTPPARPGPIAFAFLCDDPTEVDATFRRLVDAGYESALAPWDAFWGQRYATVHDPDGNAIHLFAGLGDS
ncbi:MAG: glyoxalase [Gammaproteobacteria bacterium]|nr:glyoxalase [Gammaproteobacteria bacterium]